MVVYITICNYFLNKIFILLEFFNYFSGIGYQYHRIRIRKRKN